MNVFKEKTNPFLHCAGETKECVEFAKNFLERRSRYKNQQRAANAHIDDMCSPAPAITPAADGQETKVISFSFNFAVVTPPSPHSELFCTW